MIAKPKALQVLSMVVFLRGMGNSRHSSDLAAMAIHCFVGAF